MFPGTGYAQFTVAVNSAPYGGHVEAVPRVGTAALDTFLLQSLEWTDDVDDLPMLYSFSYAKGQASAEYEPSPPLDYWLHAFEEASRIPHRCRWFRYTSVTSALMKT